MNRASLIGHEFRIYRTYGCSVIGVRLKIMWDRAAGCRNSILEKVLANSAHLRPFDPTNGERVRVRKFAAGERKLRELRGREERK